MVVTATVALTGTMGMQLLPMHLQHYGRYRQTKGICDPFYEFVL